MAFFFHSAGTRIFEGLELALRTNEKALEEARFSDQKQIIALLVSLRLYARVPTGDLETGTKPAQQVFFLIVFSGINDAYKA